MGGIDGLEILTLNPNYINQYFDNNLKQILTQSGFNFAKDWSKMTNEEGVMILRDIEGIYLLNISI